MARVADITFDAVGGNVQTVSFRSFEPTGWTTPTPKAEGTEPTNFEQGIYSAGDKNLSYDPEGQATGSGWGITQYLWNFDGGTHTVSGQGTETIDENANGGCDEFQVRFQLAAGENSRTFNVTLTVVDAQGAQKSLTRKVTLNRF